MTAVRDWFGLVRFSHSIFALPFALCGAWLAAGGAPGWRIALLVVACAVAARTAAMGFNRLVDRGIDAANPRTNRREIPAGKLGVGAVRGLVVLASVAFVALAFALNPLAGWLATPVLAVLLGYSYVKRISSGAHFVLGLALAIAPLGAWIAVRGAIEPDVTPVLWLAGAVLTWVAGFDLIYACQDAEFDRTSGLFSIPAKFGVANALRISSALHVVTVATLVMVGTTAGLGLAWWIALAVCAVLLVWQHRLVAPGDLSRVDMAFFTLNGWVGVGLFAGLALDRAIANGSV